MSTLVLATLVLAQPSFLERIETAADFDVVSLESGARPFTATTKFLAPASEDPGLLPVLYQNVNVYPFHVEFMRTEFPDRFPGLDDAEYGRIVMQRETRSYFAGSVTRIEPGDDDLFYGFDFFTDPAERPTREEAIRVFERLTATFSAGPLLYAPERADVRALVETWEDTPFLLFLPDIGVLGDYRAYTTGTAYGWARIFTIDELVAASELGSLTWQDAVFVDQAPRDLTAPVACVLTGTSQSDLSHLGLRLAQRGTPNAFRAGVTEDLAAFRDRLVRVDVSPGEVDVVEADLEEANAWWNQNRRQLPFLPDPDFGETRMMSLDAMALDPEAASRYGAKAANLAYLRAALGAEYVVDGFAVPFSWHRRFMEENRIPNPFGGGDVTYAEYVSLVADHAGLAADPVQRTALLERFVEYAEENGEVSRVFVEAVAVEILKRFGSTTFKVRSRSSASFEDIVPFNGAGLYLSTSACAADSLDRDDHGPSRCDGIARERSIERAFGRVWSSLWLPRAFNERDFWSAPHELAAMGILITPAFDDELVNAVIVTGNPTLAGDDRYIINAQKGEVEVVDPPPGILPEKVLLEVEDGAVTEILRVRPSTLAAAGEWLLSDEELRLIGSLAARAAAELGPRFEVDLPGDILIDLEFKVVDEAGERKVVFKQARPFLREEVRDDGAVAIVIPPGATACGVFRERAPNREDRGLPEEYELLTTAFFTPGRIELPARPGNVPGELFDEVLVGPELLAAVPDGEGRFTCVVSAEGSTTFYEYSFTQRFRVGETALEVRVERLNFRVDPVLGDRREIVFDDLFLSLELVMNGTLGGAVPNLYYASCEYGFLPLFETTVVASTGERAVLETRFQPVSSITGPENLVAASVDLGGERREQADYWGLVFSAAHHNLDKRFWVFLDPPIADVHLVELREATRFARPAQPAAFRLLDGEFRVLRELEVAEWNTVWAFEVEDPVFRRGDVNVDRDVDIADAIRLLDALFRGGAPLACKDAADANDDGRVDIADAVGILLNLFSAARFDFPEPVGHCGKDRTPDALECEYDVGACS